MTTTIRLPSNSRHYGGDGAVARTLAVALNRSVDAVNQSLHGPDGYWARVDRDAGILCNTGHGEWVARRLERIARHVRQSRATLTPELLLAAQEADAAEDVAESRYLLWQTSDALEEARRAKERAILRDMAVVDAMTNELQRRGVR